MTPGAGDDISTTTDRLRELTDSSAPSSGRQPGADSVVALVAAVARNGVIGRDGTLPWHLPGELTRFKALTWGHVLVMGRKTYDSIGRPLPGRTTVVVTRQPDWQPVDGPHEGLLVASSLSEALVLAADIDERVFVVGGGEIYAEAMAQADELVITWVDQAPDGDAYFPNVDDETWHARSHEDHEGWSIVHYARFQPDAKKV